MPSCYSSSISQDCQGVRQPQLHLTWLHRSGEAGMGISMACCCMP